MVEDELWFEGPNDELHDDEFDGLNGARQLGP